MIFLKDLSMEFYYLYDLLWMTINTLENFQCSFSAQGYFYLPFFGIYGFLRCTILGIAKLTLYHIVCEDSCL